MLESVAPEYLLNCLFDENYDRLLELEDNDNNIFYKFPKNTDLNNEILKDFEKLDNLFDLFKSMKIGINEICSDKSNKSVEQVQCLKNFLID